MNSNELADRFIQRFDGLLVNRGDFSREGLTEWFAANVTQQPLREPNDDDWTLRDAAQGLNSTLRSMQDHRDDWAQPLLHIREVELLLDAAQEKLSRTEQADGRAEVTQLMVDRFLGGRLPKSVCADPCASMQYDGHDRSGTNLLTATEAKYMLEVALGIRCGGCGHIPLVVGADCEEEPACPCACNVWMLREHR
jgi:hypothetical protein